MPIIPENIKNYFETLINFSKDNVFKEKDIKENISEMEIRNLFPECHAEKAIDSLNEEFKLIQSIQKDSIKRFSPQSMKSLELMAVLYQLHGGFMAELKVYKYYQKLSDMIKNLDDKNFGLALEAFWHMMHDSKAVIPLRSVELCKKIVINVHTKKREHRYFIVDLAKVLFKTVNPVYEELLEEIHQLRIQYQSYFDKSSLDSFMSRAQLSYYTFILQVKAERLKKYTENFNHAEAGHLMRKISMKVLDYLKKKNSNLNMLTGSYETLYYMWTFVNMLLISLCTITEIYTLMGMDREAKQFQYEFFKTSLIYAVPHKTRIAVRLMMHNDYINLRIPELRIRDSQLHFLRTNDATAVDTIGASHQSMSSGTAMDDYDLPMVIEDFEFFGTGTSKKKSKQMPHNIYINSSTDSEKLVNLEDCYLSKSFWKNEFIDVLAVIRTYIWKVNSLDKRFSDDNQWENMFIPPKEDEENFSQEFMDSVSLLTPVKLTSKCASMNAPARMQRRQPPIGPLKKGRVTTKQSKQDESDDDATPIDSCDTVVIPYRARNIRYEIPELPRSIHYDDSLESYSSNPSNASHCSPDSGLATLSSQDSCLSSPSGVQGERSVIDYLIQHVNDFKFVQVPVLHRPIFQRLGLHYLSKGDHKNAAFNFSMAINIGFRQLYQQDCSLKIRLKNEDAIRWTATSDIVSHCVVSETHQHQLLSQVLPVNWTVIQLSMIDDIHISRVKSSLLDGSEGGCMGARNVAVMVATKYQKCQDGTLAIENRVIHGFKATGLQLMEHFEKLKTDNVHALSITDKRVWWKKRYEIETEIETLITQMGKDWFTEADLNWLLDNGSALKSEPKILITDRHLGRAPWECIFTQNQSIARCITRMPNVVSIVGHMTQIRYRNVKKLSPKLRRVNLEVDPTKAFFIVNPDNSLQDTEDTLLPMFKEKLKWDGVWGQNSKSLDFVKIIGSKDLTMYCGHGSGYRYLRDKAMKQVTSPSALFLIGCYSARYSIEGRSEAISSLMHYLCNGCPIVLGLQWDVTDREIDKFTQQMIAGWLSKEAQFSLDSQTYLPLAPLQSYVFSKETSEGLKLPTLTGKSTITYGLPLWLSSNSVVPDLTS